jgi:hypothetical protein
MSAENEAAENEAAERGLSVKSVGISFTIMNIDMEDAHDEQREIRVRPGYIQLMRDNQTYIRPAVFGPGSALPLATTRKPDLTQAIDQVGGVSAFFRVGPGPEPEYVVERNFDKC